MALEKLYSVEEVAEMTAVTTRTIRNYLRKGVLTGTKIGGQWRFRQEDIMHMFNQEKTASDFRETSSRIVRDFLGGQYKPFSKLVSICTVADVACTKEQAKAMSKTLCALWKQADIRGITFRYDYLEDSEAARFTFVAPLTLTENALAVLHQIRTNNFKKSCSASPAQQLFSKFRMFSFYAAFTS